MKFSWGLAPRSSLNTKIGKVNAPDKSDLTYEAPSALAKIRIANLIDVAQPLHPEIFSGDVADALKVTYRGKEINARFSCGGIYTGSAADYANRSRRGGVDDGPSLVKVGSGEGAQVYGWGLYGSTVRGVAEGYARNAADKDNAVLMLDGRKLRRKQYSKAMLKVEDLLKAAKGELWMVDNYLNDKNKKLNGLLIEARDWFNENKNRIKIEVLNEHLYEQTFFTDRAPGDESHLLKWYEPVSEEQKQWIGDQLKKEGLDASIIEKSWRYIIHRETGHDLGAYDTGNDVYDDIKDGDEVGWNYVSFRDDNIRVDHKWTDGEAKFARGGVSISSDPFAP